MTRRHRTARTRSRLLIVLCAWTATAQAAPPGGEVTEEQKLAEDLKSQEDPTLLKSRAWLESEWNDDRHDSSSFEQTLGGRKGWRMSDNHDWALQVELPYRRVHNGSGADTTREGFADIKVSAGTAVRLSDTWRIGGGLELRMPTAERELSGNIWRLQEFVAVAWDATPWLTFTPKVRYFHTLARDSGATPQHYMEIFVPAMFLLPDHWSVTPRYEAKLDFENDRTTHSGKLSIGKQFRDPEIGLSLSAKVPINRSSNQYQLIFNATKYF